MLVSLLFHTHRPYFALYLANPSGVRVSRVILCIVSSVHRDPARLGRSLIEDTAAKKQPWIGEERVLSNLIKESRRHLLESKIDFVFEEHRRGSIWTAPSKPVSEDSARFCLASARLLRSALRSMTCLFLGGVYLTWSRSAGPLIPFQWARSSVPPFWPAVCRQAGY